MKYYWICLRADGTAGLYETEPNKVVSYEDFCYIKSECDMEWAECVTIVHNDKAYQVILDEEGKLNHKSINHIATMMYTNLYDVIVGDVAILSYPNGEDMEYMTEADAMELFNYIKSCSE